MDYLIKLWDVASGKHVATFSNSYGGTIRHLAFSPDGKLLAAAYGRGNTVLYDVANRKRVAKIDAHERTDNRADINHVAFSPDGKLLATGGEKVDDLGEGGKLGG